MRTRSARGPFLSAFVGLVLSMTGSARVLLPMLAATAVLWSAAARAQGENIDRWYSLTMMGANAGVMNVTQKKDEQGNITTRTTLELEVKRGEIGVKIEMESSFVETAAGKPVSMRSVQKYAAVAVENIYTFTPEGLELVTSQQGNKTRRMLPLPEGEWLTPAAAEAFTRQGFKTGAKQITLRTIDPLTGATPMTVTRSVQEKTTIQVNNRPIEVTRSVVKTAEMAGADSVEWVDENGEMVRSETKLGMIAVVMTRAASEAEAKKGRAGAELPEMMVSTFIKPDRKINDPRRVQVAIYTLSVPEGELPELPDTGSQRFERIDAMTARLTVSYEPQPDGPTQAAIAGEPTRDPFKALPAAAEFTRATAMANSDDEAIRTLTKRATAEAARDPALRAEAMRRFVHRFVRSKNLGVGFATATEVARTREGDCTEHAVLLAAMLRADGIPSRCVVGLIYADTFAGSNDIFGYHMWTQALVMRDGKPAWVDLDATLPGNTRFDATHIALGLAELGENDLTGGMLKVASVIGRLSIKVDETK